MNESDVAKARDMVVSADSLRHFSTALLHGAGMPGADAALAATVIIDANLRGVDTHGAFNLRLYVKRLHLGLINPVPKMTFERRRTAVGVFDADGGMGQVATVRAMEHAVEMARETGVATVLVTNSNHFGAAAYYVNWAAQQNCVGMVWSPAESSVVPFNGRKRFFGTNPIAISAPRGNVYPGFTVDMATSVVAGGKYYKAAKEHKTIPEGWVIDDAGRSVTQPSDDDAVFSTYSGLPMGGAKGYGFATMIEFTTSLLMGTQWGPTIVRWGEDFDHKVNISHYVQAMDVEAFVAIDDYRRRVDEFCAELKAIPPVEGVGEVLLPGEPELRTARQRAAAGCPLTAHTVAMLAEAAAGVGVPFTLRDGS
jgi:LDH2 family malate/lactate/ureidoglycolate dehydrogenase